MIDHAHSIQSDLWILDALLTGRDPRSGRGDPDKMVDPFDVLQGELYYLSDGGYSRVYYRCEEGPLCLASESTDEVKAKWHTSDVSLVRFRLQQTVEDYHRELLK